MNRTLVIIARGIGEPLTNSMLKTYLQPYLPDTEYEFIELPWSAEYGPVPSVWGDPFENSIGEGEQLAIDWCRNDFRDRRVVLAGYSGGAELMGNVLARLAAETPSHGVVAGLLLSDPSQPKGLPETGGKYGIRGSREVGESIPVRWFYELKDAICVCTPEPDSLLRIFADASSEFSLAGPRAWQGTIARLRFKKFQWWALPWHDLNKIKWQVDTAIYEAQGYLSRGDHVSYPSRVNSNGKPYFEDMADWIKFISA